MQLWAKIGGWMSAKGHSMVTEGRKQDGMVNLQSILLMGLGFVFIAVGFIVFQIVTEACEDILDWTCTANTSTTDATFTGFPDVVGITPLLVLVSFIAAGVFTMYLGIKVGQGMASTHVDLGVLILLALAMIFIAIALIIMPVTLEAICSTLSNNSGAADSGQGLNSAFTGLSDFLLMTPLLLQVALIGGAVVTGFFGMKRLGA